MSVFTLDIADDLLLVDGLQPMTLVVDGKNIALPHVLDEPPHTKEMAPSNATVLQGDHFFVWPAKDFTAPPVGAHLIDSRGDCWVILDVEYQDLVDIYECQCRRLWISETLKDTATIMHATYTKAEGGDARAHWKRAMPNVPARFQPMTDNAEIMLDAEYTKETFTVYFACNVPAQIASAEYRLRDQAGNIYRVLSYFNSQRIDVLPHALATRVTEQIAGEV